MSRRKGATYALAIRRWLEAQGWECMARQPGEDGDDIRILDLPHLSIEIKNQARHDLPGWMTQAVRQAGHRIPVVIHKRHGVTNPEDQWVTLRLADFHRLIKQTERV
jgi:hypothetical protein